MASNFLEGFLMRPGKGGGAMPHLLGEATHKRGKKPKSAVKPADLHYLREVAPECRNTSSWPTRDGPGRVRRDGWTEMWVNG